MVQRKKFIDVEGFQISQDDIKSMAPEQIHQLLAFVEEKDLDFIYVNCCDVGKTIIDNLRIKLSFINKKH